jgi:hypothetical protein
LWGRPDAGDTVLLEVLQLAELGTGGAWMDVGFTSLGSELFDVGDYVLDEEVLASVVIDQDMTLFIVEGKRARANVEDRGLGK